MRLSWTDRDNEFAFDNCLGRKTSAGNKKGAGTRRRLAISRSWCRTDRSDGRETLFIGLTNGRSIFGRPRLLHAAIDCSASGLRSATGVVTGTPVLRVSTLCDPGHRKHTLNTQAREHRWQRAGRILYGQDHNNHRNTTCIPAPWTDSPRRTDDYPSRSTAVHGVNSTRRERTRWSMHQLALSRLSSS